MKDFYAPLRTLFKEKRVIIEARFVMLPMQGRKTCRARPRAALAFALGYWMLPLWGIQNPVRRKDANSTWRRQLFTDKHVWVFFPHLICLDCHLVRIGKKSQAQEQEDNFNNPC